MDGPLRFTFSNTPSAPSDRPALINGTRHRAAGYVGQITPTLRGLFIEHFEAVKVG
jgi:hypothetical protein